MALASCPVPGPWPWRLPLSPLRWGARPVVRRGRASGWVAGAAGGAPRLGRGRSCQIACEQATRVVRSVRVPEPPTGRRRFRDFTGRPFPMPTAQNAPFFPFERQLIAPELGRGEIVDEVDVNCWAAVEEVAMAASIWSSLYMICYPPFSAGSPSCHIRSSCHWREHGPNPVLRSYHPGARGLGRVAGILCGANRSRFAELHEPQAATQLSSVLAPPRDRGIMWSAVLAGSPQYWHV
jgi:hypothetical protein